jgi:Subunit ChlI of Mg-chelatase
MADIGNNDGTPSATLGTASAPGAVAISNPAGVADDIMLGSGSLISASMYRDTALTRHATYLDTFAFAPGVSGNLAPADVRKEGPSFDLPIAVGMLKLEENNRLPELSAFCINGERALSGQLRPVKGVLSIPLEAERRCRQTLIVPHENPRRSRRGGGCRCVRGVFALRGGAISAWRKILGTGTLNQRLVRRRISRTGP